MFILVIISALCVFFYWFIYKTKSYPFIRLNWWAKDENVDKVGYLRFMKNGVFIWFFFVFTGWMVKEIFEKSEAWYGNYFVITTLCLAVIVTIGGKRFAYTKRDDVPVESQVANIKKGPFLSEIIGAVIVVGSLSFLYLGYKESAATCDSKNFELQGLWGMVVPISEISSADTISWIDMAPVSLRISGISLMGVNRGKFKMKDLGMVQLNLNCRSNPVIRIVDKAKRFYFVNRKDPKITRRLFVDIQRNLTR